jgi:hypothetical protein
MSVSVQALPFFLFLCAVGGTKAVIILISEAVTLRGKEKDRPLQDWLSLGRIFILLISRPPGFYQDTS